MLEKIQNLKSALFTTLSLVLITITIVAALAIHFSNLQTALTERYYDLKIMSQEIIYYDEVLTMSALTNAYSNDDKWLRRYKKNEIQLESILKRAINYDPLVADAIRITDSANNALVDMEKEAFHLVQSNKQEQAIELLSSSQYLAFKRQYSQGIRLAMKKMLSIAERDLIESHRQKANVFVAVMLSFIVIFFLLWIYLLRYMRTTDKHIDNLVQYDELSGLYNRRVFNEILPLELQRCERDSNILMLVILDIDNFKSYNDTYGHPLGDSVITAVGKVLRDCTRRATESAFRIGGEEFTVIASCEEKQAALNLISKILKGVEELAIPHEKNVPFGRVTISAGAAFSSGISSTADLTLYHQADEALYKAKADGKSQFHEYDGIKEVL